jgi:Ser/Thr protein kinase RdoA (MazF antagonist)
VTAPLACAESIPLPASLVPEIVEAYDVGSPLSCELMSAGLDATYLLETREARFVIRLYNARWWAPAEIQYELKALVHLAQRRVAVARPVARRDGALATTVLASEGPRELAVFEFVDGELFEPATDAREYGWTAAAIHSESQDFTCAELRRPLDITGLLRASFEPVLRQLGPELAVREYFLGLQARVERRVAETDWRRLDHGFCHGDFNFSNCRRGAERTITVFDFECCAPGLRAYDLAVFRWTQKLLGVSEMVWTRFLEGYQERRRIGEQDLAAIGLLTLLRQTWLIGHDAQRTEVFSNGSHWRRTGRIRNLKFLEQLDHELFDGL